MDNIEICVDFDGTCVTHEFPEIGKDIIGAAIVLRELVANGHKLILFTMRSDFNDPKSDHPEIVPVSKMYLTAAINWFKERDIPLYGIQTNPTQSEWTSSPKAYGQIYLDDAALGCPLIHDLNYSSRPFVNWIEVREMLIKKGVL